MAAIDGDPKLYLLSLRDTAAAAAAERILATVGYVQEAVLVLVARVDLTHGRRGLRYGFIDEQEDGLFRWQLDALAYDPHELGDRDVVGHEELALVNLWYLRVGDSLDNDWDSVRVLGPDLFGFGLSLLQSVLFAESELHLLSWFLAKAFVGCFPFLLFVY